MRRRGAPWSGGIDHISRARWKTCAIAFGVASVEPVLTNKRADAVAVDAEILVAALRDDHLVARPQMPRSPRILVEAASEALVGDVDERDHPRSATTLVTSPTGPVEVGAGRIVAAAVEQGDVARRSRVASASSMSSNRTSACRGRNRDIRPSRDRRRG